MSSPTPETPTVTVALTDDVVEIYRNDAGEWRWRRKSAGNGEILSMASEGYTEHAHTVAMALRCNPNVWRIGEVQA